MAVGRGQADSARGQDLICVTLSLVKSCLYSQSYIGNGHPNIEHCTDVVTPISRNKLHSLHIAPLSH